MTMANAGIWALNKSNSITEYGILVYLASMAPGALASQVRIAKDLKIHLMTFRKYAGYLRERGVLEAYTLKPTGQLVYYKLSPEIVEQFAKGAA